MIDNIPTSKIRSIAMGLVEVYGQVIPDRDELLCSPFSKKDCIYYKYTIEEYKSEGSGRWVIVDEDIKSLYFYLQDDTGSVLVDPTDAKIKIPIDYKWKSGLSNDPPPEVKSFIRSRGIEFEGFLGINKSMRYREYLIEPGDMLYIMGTAGDNPFVENGSSQENVQDIMIQKSGNEIYYISDRPEIEILRGLYLNTLFGIYGGAALSVISLIIIAIIIATTLY